MNQKRFDVFYYNNVNAWLDLTHDLLCLGSFSVVEAAVHTWQDTIQCLLASTYTVPNVFAFFIIPNFFNRVVQ